MKNKLDWINVSDRKKPKDSPMPKQFGIYAVPSYLIVNKVGHIVYNSDQEDVGVLKFESSIRDLLHLN